MPTAQKEDLFTAAKLADAWGVPKSALSKKLKEFEVEPDLVKAGCSYYSRVRLEKIRRKLGV
ncbi:MAG: hypothetical protein ACT4PO_07460 [Actinomycetota bacterium]